jgi:hypothetical protein
VASVFVDLEVVVVFVVLVDEVEVEEEDEEDEEEEGGRGREREGELHTVHVYSECDHSGDDMYSTLPTPAKLRLNHLLSKPIRPWSLHY